MNGGVGYVESANYNPVQGESYNYDLSEAESEDRLDDESEEYEEEEEEDELEERTVGSVLTIDDEDEKED